MNLSRLLTSGSITDYAFGMQMPIMVSGPWQRCEIIIPKNPLMFTPTLVENMRYEELRYHEDILNEIATFRWLQDSRIRWTNHSVTLEIYDVRRRNTSRYDNAGCGVVLEEIIRVANRRYSYNNSCHNHWGEMDLRSAKRGKLANTVHRYYLEIPNASALFHMGKHDESSSSRKSGRSAKR